jgi:hypothetical protein
MPIMGVATAARKKSNSKSWPAKETIWRLLPQTGTKFPFAPTRCEPVGGAELECGRIEIEAPESTKKFMLLFESSKKIRFLVGKADIAVTNSGISTEGGGRQAGIGPEAAANCGPAVGLLVFLVSAALLALVGLVAEAGVVETQTVVAAALGCSRGGRAAAARFVARLVAAGRLAAVRRGGSAGVPKSRMLRRRRKRPPRESGTSTVRCNAGSSPPWCRRTAC